MVTHSKPLTENFHLSEFDCKDGTPVPGEYVANCYYIAVQLEKIRRRLGHIPLTISSGYRTSKHNKAVGGVKNSLHLTARAADICCQKSSKFLYDEIRTLIEMKVIPDGEVILYTQLSGNFVHYAPEFHPRFCTVTVLK